MSGSPNYGHRVRRSDSRPPEEKIRSAWVRAALTREAGEIVVGAKTSGLTAVAA